MSPLSFPVSSTLLAETATSVPAASLAVPALQAQPAQIAGTVGSLIVLLTVTAHIAARNVLGDVPPINAVGVGPAVGPFALLPEAFNVPPVVAIGLALVADSVAIKYLYGRSWRLTAYVTLIHAVVSILVGAVIVSLFLLLASTPG